MRRLISLLILGLTLGTVTAEAGLISAQQNKDTQKLEIAALPSEVRDALSRAHQLYPTPLNGAQWSLAHKMPATEHPIFQVQGTNGRGNKVEMEITSAGRIIEVEEHGIPMAEVPNVVSQALKTNLPDFQPTRIEAIYQNREQSPVMFGFEKTDAAGNKTEVYISADGKIVGK